MNKREQKKLLKKIEEATSLSDLKNICYDNGAEGFLDDYLTDDEALDYIKNTCDSMERFYYCTTEIKDWSRPYFYLDNYSNLQNADEGLQDLRDMVFEHIVEIN